MHLLGLNPAIEEDPVKPDGAILSHIAELKKLARTNRRKFRIVLALLVGSAVLVLALIVVLVVVLVKITQNDPCDRPAGWLLDSMAAVDDFLSQVCVECPFVWYV